MLAHFLLVLFLSTILYCSSEESNSANPWAYYEKKGSLSMTNWKTKYPNCDGKQQSPINIVTSKTKPLKKKIQLFGSCKDSILQSDATHTYTWIPSNDSTCGVTVGTQVYKLASFHIHTPSEHTINGKHSDLEIHFVHQNKHNNKLVISILADMNTTSSSQVHSLSKLLHYISMKQNIHLQQQPNFYKSLFHKNNIIYHYAGSLTTPPCSEGVQWYVRRNPIKLSKNQFASIQKIMSLVKAADNGKNNRLIQKLNHRNIFKIKAKTTQRKKNNN